MKNNYLAILVIFISCSLLSHGQTQVPNGNFEDWTMNVDSNLNPDFWETNNAYPTAVSVSPYTPAYSGNFSLHVEAVNISGFNMAGMALASFPYVLRPSSMRLVVKANIMPGDIAYINYAAWAGSTAIASPDSCSFKVDATISNWTVIHLPITYLSSLDPDSATILIIAGNLSTPQVGTEIFVDEISLITGVEEIKGVQVSHGFPNPASEKVTIPLTLNKTSAVIVMIYNNQGQEIMKKVTTMLPGKRSLEIPVKGMPTGIYRYLVNGDGFSIPGNFAVTK